ncbi:MAG TPA: hypothetical protein ENO02_10180 [Epsilonproteobacteria bacterium]|nr:hypothetical protein [Campylobacterota bacterium]
MSKKQKRTYHIDTLMTKDEYERITLKADMYGIKKSQYMRNVSLAYPLPPCRADQKALQELVRTHADINRLGGLFKLWLTKDQKALGSKGYNSIDQLVDHIEDTSKKILEISEKLL